FEAAVMLYESEEPFDRLELKAKLIHIMAIIARQWQRENGRDAAKVPSAKDIDPQKNQIFWSIVEHVNLNINQVLSTQLLAERYNVSKSYISINFKKHFGLTYHEYINEMRLRNAEALLLSTDLPITDIAYEAGFESFSTFSRLFKAYRGETASSFRKRQHMQ
ncbi:MAG: helix-turn-helix transcriptional regulator, partial [Proteobacteria bacterium]|nr:helix-turn-helix transcriptional regulator [Pseudomonadota bacterium]